MDVREKFIEQYINKLSASNYVGVEIEMPIINTKSPYIIDEKIIKDLFNNLLNLDFKILSKDNDGRIVAVRNEKNGDTISLEYSFNTLELSLNKELNIYKLEEKFLKYYKFIQNILSNYDYKLCDVGINPNYKKINRNCLNQNRYKAIEKLLTGGKNDLYSQFCSYCCSIQTHINVNKDELVDVLNLFTLVEENKQKLFSNSYMSETKLQNSRKFLWENSNFGPKNIGSNKIFTSVDDVIDDYLDRNLFFIEKNNEFLLLKEKTSLINYFSNDLNIVLNKDNNEIEIKPNIKDFNCFRSYKTVELSKYGTLEIRTDCMQNINNIFKLVAFNVGISKNYKEIIEYIKENKKISNDKLIKFCIKGLKERGYCEEKYLEESRMKKIGIWMYENDNGYKIKKKLESLLRKKGYEVYSNFDMRECYLKDGKVYSKEGYCLSDLDIFYHMNADEQNQYQNDILRLLELSGVHVFNDYQSFIYCKDKVISNLLLRKNGVLVPPSMLINNKLTKDDLKKIIDEWGTIIVKPRVNHGGKGIVKIDSYELFCDFYEATKLYTENYYLEKYIPFDKHDYRVEVFNGEVVGTYCRGKYGSYKTNISSGGSMQDIKVTDEFKKIALKAAKILKITTTIVDMILSEEDGKIYVLEVNPIMGIFLEEGMRAGTKMPVQKSIPKSFKTDKTKINKIVDYIDAYFI